MRITLIIYKPSTMTYHSRDGHKHNESQLAITHGDSEKDFELLAESMAKGGDGETEVTVLVNGIPIDELFGNAFFEELHYCDKLDDRCRVIREERRVAAAVKVVTDKANAARRALEATDAARAASEAADRATYEALRKRFE